MCFIVSLSVSLPSPPSKQLLSSVHVDFILFFYLKNVSNIYFAESIVSLNEYNKIAQAVHFLQFFLQFFI